MYFVVFQLSNSYCLCVVNQVGNNPKRCIYIFMKNSFDLFRLEVYITPYALKNDNNK